MEIRRVQKKPTGRMRMNLLSITKALGQRIRYFRKLRKMSQALLGALMHVSQQVIAKYESGRAMLPAIRVPSLCEALDITTDELFAGLPRFMPVRMGRRARLTATRAGPI
jgi:transcriptional regulator with XRE-family HTH domain